MGVEEIEAQGKPFDPRAARRRDAAALYRRHAESGTVTQVLQKGYRLDGKVIRHASVAVAE